MISNIKQPPITTLDEFTNDTIEYRIQSIYNSIIYTIAYVGKYSYLIDSYTDNGIEGDVTRPSGLCHNLQIGQFNSIAMNVKFMFSQCKNIKSVSNDALNTYLNLCGLSFEKPKETMRYKGSIIIQNDVWIGKDVTIMPGVTIHNGAIIARNSHVVSDVPPYAIVGGNPAKIIGYKFNQDLINKLQTIQWWYWSPQELIDNHLLLNEDVEGFCNRFYDSAKQRLDMLIGQREFSLDGLDSYFAFVDYYENLSNYENILENFFEKYICDPTKKLYLFIQTDCPNISYNDYDVFQSLTDLISHILSYPQVKCQIEVLKGDNDFAKEIFLKCNHYLISRTYRGVEYSCLADLVGIEVLSGVDINIAFEKNRNITIKN